MGDDWHEFFEDFPDQNPANWVNGEYRPPGANASRMWDWVDARETEECAKQYLSALLTGRDEALLKLGLVDLDALAGARSALLNALDGPFVRHEVVESSSDSNGDDVVDIRLTTSAGKSALVRLTFTRGPQKVESLTIVA